MDTAPVPTNSTDDYDTLIKDLNHRVWEVRRDSCEELGLRGDKRAVQHLVRLLADGVGAVRFSAADALGKLGDKSVIPQLIKQLDNAHFGAYGPVIESLANLKAAEAIPHFIKFLRDPDARLRGLAANALMVITRQLIVFKAKGGEEEREASIKQWETWWSKNKATFKT
ncbi:MAG: HEAT repeat domain-containing protein [Planctomycetes bacterium]|nr:HEAT repeat domain-containing protein [Planctomycetota bacterium]